jgi:hypothetical protein
VTPEGLTVWILKRPGLPKITATLAVRGGSAADAAGLEGTSEILGEVLRAGTKTRSAQKTPRSSAGRQLGANATDDATTSVDARERQHHASPSRRRRANAAYRTLRSPSRRPSTRAQGRRATPEFFAERAFGKARLREPPVCSRRAHGGSRL